MLGFPFKTMRWLGWEGINQSSPGTGYLNTGGGASSATYISRIGDLQACSPPPDVIVAPVSWNDRQGASPGVFTPGALDTAIRTLVNAIRTGTLPNAATVPIVIPGIAVGFSWDTPVSGAAGNTGTQAANNQGRTTVQSLASTDANVHWIETDPLNSLTLGHWSYGTGHQGAVTGDGPADVYIWTGAAHPGYSGHTALGLYMAQLIATELGLRLASSLPIIPPTPAFRGAMLSLANGLNVAPTNRSDSGGGQTLTNGYPVALDTSIAALDQGAPVTTILGAGLPANTYVGLVSPGPSRTDASCGITSGSPTVTDTAITAADQGKMCWCQTTPGAIPAGSYVGVVTAGVSFTLSSSPTNPNATVNAQATVTAGVVVGGMFLLSSSQVSQVSVNATGNNTNGLNIGGDVGSGGWTWTNLTWDTGVYDTTGFWMAPAAGRLDTATVTNGSATVTDTSIAAADQGKLVSSLNNSIPTNPLTYVGTVTPGASFLLSSSPSSQVNVNAVGAATSVVIGGGYQFRIPPGQGIQYVKLTGLIAWQLSSKGYRAVQLLKNGSTAFYGAFRIVAPVLPKSIATMDFATAVLPVADNDTLQLQVSQSSGGNTLVGSSAGTNGSWVSLEVLDA
jgi:hypothetical protein